MKKMNKVIAAMMMMAITFAMPAMAGNHKKPNNHGKNDKVVVVNNDKKAAIKREQSNLFELPSVSSLDQRSRSPGLHYAGRDFDYSFATQVSKLLYSHNPYDSVLFFIPLPVLLWTASGITAEVVAEERGAGEMVLVGQFRQRNVRL